MKTLYDWIPERQWKSWSSLPRPHRALQIAAFVADTLRPRESSPNRGEIIDAIHRQAGYDPADALPYCAIFVTACLTMAGYRRNEIPQGPAAVRSWVTHGRSAGWDVRRPARADLCYWLRPDGRGHIGFVVRVHPFGFIESIEGNTRPDASGNQRDGDGVYRRTRTVVTWDGFLRLPQ